MPVQRRYIVEPLDGYPQALGRALWSLQDARSRTRRALENLPADALDWIPAAGRNSIGTLLYHIAAIELDWLYCEILEQSGFPEEIQELFPHDVRDDQGRLSVVKGISLTEHVARLETVRGLFMAALRGIDLDDFRRARSLKEYIVTPEWALHHLMQHEAEHRGQIIEIRAAAMREQKA